MIVAELCDLSCRYREQASKPQLLVKGTCYYLEATMVERTGKDSLSVGVKYPNGQEEKPIRSYIYKGCPRKNP